jgi:hypothetical protein
MNTINWTLIRARLKEAILVLPHFFKNPVQGMRRIPDWEWPEILILQSIFAAICSMLTNAVGRHWLLMILGLFIGPITQLILVSLAAGIFYYVFLFWFQREISYRRIYLQLLFASVPALIVNILSPILPPVFLIGLAAALILLYVGFSENFALERKKLQKLLGGIFAIYALFWMVQLINRISHHDRMHVKATPESLDILEKEINTGK